MFKFLALCSFCLYISAQVHAQSHDDSVKERAKIDAKMFHLNVADFQKFKKNKRRYNPAFFLPTRETASDPKFLNDSVYVKTFSELAWKRTRRRYSNPLNSNLPVSGTVVVAAATVVVAFALAAYLVIKALEKGINSSVK